MTRSLVAPPPITCPMAIISTRRRRAATVNSQDFPIAPGHGWVVSKNDVVDWLVHKEGIILPGLLGFTMTHIKETVFNQLLIHAIGQ